MMINMTQRHMKVKPLMRHMKVPPESIKETETYWHFQGAKKDCTLPVAWQLALTEMPCHCQASNCISA